MAAVHPFLNTITAVNDSYLDRLLDMGLTNISSAIREIETISANTLPELDFSGTSPNLVNPTDVSIGALPAAPVKPVLNNVPIDAMPSSPVLTTDTIATDIILRDTLSQLITKAQFRINNATGLIPAVEAAIFGRGVDRETRSMRNKFDNFVAGIASRGWSSPSGQNKATRARFETELAQNKTELSREIMNKQADLEQANAHQALVLFQGIMGMLADMKRGDEANKVALYGTSIDAILKKAQVYVSVNQGYIDNFASEVQAYTALATTTVNDAELRLKQVSSLNDMNTQLSTIAMKRLEILSNHEASNAGLATEASKAIASVMGQLAATLMNSINISQSFSTGKSWSFGESVST